MLGDFPVPVLLWGCSVPLYRAISNPSSLEQAGHSLISSHDCFSECPWLWNNVVTQHIFQRPQVSPLFWSLKDKYKTIGAGLGKDECCSSQINLDSTCGTRLKLLPALSLSSKPNVLSKRRRFLLSLGLPDHNGFCQLQCIFYPKHTCSYKHIQLSTPP